MVFKEDGNLYSMDSKYRLYNEDSENISGEDIMNNDRGTKGRKGSNITDGEIISKELLRAASSDINKVLDEIDKSHPEIYSDFSRYNVNRTAARYILSLAIGYTLDNKNKYSGDDNKKADGLLRDFYGNNKQVLILPMISGLPANMVRNIFRKVILITLLSSKGQERPPSKGSRWSSWEDLGGILTSAPGACSWGKNRMDVFVRGTDKSMYHKFYNGRWSNWQNLGGVLESSPAACSWGYNRIDTFVKGSDNAMYHKWWNGSRWSDWESLGGVLTSSPAACSWGYNRIDTFAKGSDNAMWHKWWDGNRWSNWESLGGTLTSSPAACSWGPNRIDTFVKGSDNAMWHKWWNGAKWSDWESLGGRITSGVAAVSTEPNSIDCFARGVNNELIWKRWNGNSWSKWSSVGGILRSEPAACSWGRNRIDVFARGGNDQLWHIYKM